MIKINIVGDFSIINIDGFSISKDIKSILDEGDLNLVNLEGPVVPKGTPPAKKSGDNLCQDNNTSKLLEESGFNVITLANNHIMDFGAEGLNHTVESFHKSLLLGAGSFNEAYKIGIVNVGDKRIGFISITQYEFGILDEVTYCQGKEGVAWMFHPKVDEMIVNAKSSCDFLFVLPHAGLEMFGLPLPEIRTLYRHFVDLGADAVIGNHPHVIQCWEMYHGKPIYYSLGNFCFDNFEGVSSYGLLVHIEIGDSVRCSHYITHYDSKLKKVRVACDEETNKRLDTQNELFKNEAKYLDAVNKKCLSMRGYYEMLYEFSGRYKMNLRRCFGLIKRILLKKEPQYKEEHFINNIRCETHRWIQSRIYEIENQ